MNESPLPTDEPASPAEQANHLALHARPGHYDELRGMVQEEVQRQLAEKNSTS